MRSPLSSSFGRLTLTRSREWYRYLKEDGVKVWCIAPGFIATGLGGSPEAMRAMGAGDPAIGGQFVKEVVEGSWDEHVGKVVSKGGIQPW